MSDSGFPNMSPGASPSGMRSVQPGKGGKRANKLALVLAVIAIAIVGGVMMITIQQRRAAQQQQGQDKATAAKAAQKPVTPEVLANHPGMGLIDAGTSPAIASTPPAPVKKDEEQGPAKPPAAVAAAVDPAVQAAWDDYHRRQRALDQARFQAEAAALGAAPDVRLEAASSRAATVTTPSGSSVGSGTGPAAALRAGSPSAGSEVTQVSAPAEANPVIAGSLGNGLLLGSNVLPQANPNANDQAGKRDFLNAPGSSNADEDYAPARVTSPRSPFELKAGAVLPATMIGGINSDLPGQVIAQVRENVFDTATGDHLLIPQGTRLVGQYHSGVTYGQTRVLVAWNRMIYPNGDSFDLGNMPGADQGAYAGFEDQVDNHYWRIFGSAVLATFFTAGVQLSQPQAQNGVLTPEQILTASAGQQAQQVGAQMVSRGLDIQPTLEIRNGYLFNVMVTKDLVLTPWLGMQPLAYGSVGR